MIYLEGGGGGGGVKRLGRETDNLASSSATVRSATTSVRDNTYGVAIKHQYALPLPLQISLLNIFFYFTNGRYIECLSLTYATNKSKA